jgi:hypothetical protein
LAGTARAEIIASELFLQHLVAVDNLRPSLDLRFGRESSTAFAHGLEKNGCSSNCSGCMAHLLCRNIVIPPLDTRHTAKVRCGYFGFVVGGSLPVSLAANWLAGAWDQNAMSSISSPIAAKLEEVVIRWLLDLLHLPSDGAGALVTGATMANLTALAAARHAVLKKHSWDVEADGLCQSPPVALNQGTTESPLGNGFGRAAS